jgi:ribonuclease VapC
MIAIDTSIVLAIALYEPERPTFEVVFAREELLIGWPTLFEMRMVLSGRGFANASDIIQQIIHLPNVKTIVFDQQHYQAAERAFEKFGKGRHPASLNMGDCFSYAVSHVSGAPLLFKGADFGKTDLKCHPASVRL